MLSGSRPGRQKPSRRIGGLERELDAETTEPIPSRRIGGLETSDPLPRDLSTTFPPDRRLRDRR